MNQQPPRPGASVLPTYLRGRAIGDDDLLDWTGPDAGERNCEGCSEKTAKKHDEMYPRKLRTNKRGDTMRSRHSVRPFDPERGWKLGPGQNQRRPLVGSRFFSTYVPVGSAVSVAEYLLKQDFHMALNSTNTGNLGT